MLFVLMYSKYIMYNLCFVPYALTLPVSGLSFMSIKICSVLFYIRFSQVDANKEELSSRGLFKYECKSLHNCRKYMLRQNGKRFYTEQK